MDEEVQGQLTNNTRKFQAYWYFEPWRHFASDGGITVYIYSNNVLFTSSSDVRVDLLDHSDDTAHSESQLTTYNYCKNTHIWLIKWCKEPDVIHTQNQH